MKQDSTDSFELREFCLIPCQTVPQRKPGSSPTASASASQHSMNDASSTVFPLSCTCTCGSSKYICHLEKDYESMQMAFFALTSHFAKVQFRLRQIIQAQPAERHHLLDELASIAFCDIDEFSADDLPRMEKDVECLGNIRRKQGHLIERLRCQMEQLCANSIPVDTETDPDEENDQSENKDLPTTKADA